MHRLEPLRLLLRCVLCHLAGCAGDVYSLTLRAADEGFGGDVLAGLVGCIVGLPGDQLPAALRLLLDCHAHWEEQRVGQKELEEGMEEGELPENEEEGTGDTQGIDPISRIMVPHPTPTSPLCVVWLVNPPSPCRTSSCIGSTMSRSLSWWAPTTRRPAALRCWSSSHGCRTALPPFWSGTCRRRDTQGRPLCSPTPKGEGVTTALPSAGPPGCCCC